MVAQENGLEFFTIKELLDEVFSRVDFDGVIIHSLEDIENPNKEPISSFTMLTTLEKEEIELILEKCEY